MSQRGTSQRNLTLTGNNVWLVSRWQTMGTKFKHEVQIKSDGHELHTERNQRPYRVIEKTTPYRKPELKRWLHFNDRKEARTKR